MVMTGQSVHLLKEYFDKRAVDDDGDDDDRDDEREPNRKSSFVRERRMIQQRERGTKKGTG